MIALFTIATFFLMLVIVYPLVCVAITLLGTARKRHCRKHRFSQADLDIIDQRTDDLKRSAFIYSIVVTFFVIAPFIALMVVFGS